MWRYLDLALPSLQHGTKSPLEKPTAAITLCNIPGWLLVAPREAGTSWESLESWSFHRAQPLHSRLPGAIGTGDSHTPAPLALYQGITQGMLQAASLSLPLCSPGNLKDPFLLSWSLAKQKKTKKTIKKPQTLQLRKEKKKIKQTCSTFGSQHNYRTYIRWKQQLHLTVSIDK